MTDKPILMLENVFVQRGDFVLCQDIDLSLMAGDICHLVGENGLGKTTLLNQIAGLMPTPQGKIHLTDRPIYVSHQLGINKDLTVAQNLRFLLSLYQAPYDDEALDFALDKVGLYGLGDIPSIQLSAGQQRRIGLARLFILKPNHTPLWLLDEPLTALDVAMVDKLEKCMADFANSGGAILTTSHQRLQGTTMQLDLMEFAL